MDFINDAIVSMDAFVTAYKPAALYFSCPVELRYLFTTGIFNVFEVCERSWILYIIDLWFMCGVGLSFPNAKCRWTHGVNNKLEERKNCDCLLTWSCMAMHLMVISSAQVELPQEFLWSNLLNEESTIVYLVYYVKKSYSKILHSRTLVFIGVNIMF